ncbi:MAG: DNA methyltransferase [Promethearchaeota archaeon]|jgi:adenine-specific DNA-methyltransferase
MKMENNEEFLSKLSKIFQFEDSDLKYSLYNLVNQKRKELHHFIQKILPNFISNKSTEVLHSEDIISSLIDFFSQYFESGKFDMQRATNKKNITFPYDGEEFLVYWVNKYQYFISSKEGDKSTDFLLHQDLRNFLESELSLYIQKKVLSLEDFNIDDEKNFQIKVMKFKIIQEIASKLISLLSQTEDFLVDLLNKKRFVLKTDYIISLDKIKELTGEIFFKTTLDKILKNNQQLEEWNDLFNIGSIGSKGIGVSRLKNLPVDTKFYDSKFKWNLLNKITQKNELDKSLDGTLIKSDNYNALNLIMRKWGENINLIYIDPPFNTGNKDFPYKNDYLISVWLTIIYNCLVQGKDILHEKGSIFFRIDNTGNHFVRTLLDLVFGNSNFRNEIVINKTKAKKQIKKPFIQQTESLFFYSKTDNYYFNQVEVPKKEPKWYELLDFPRPNDQPRTVLGKTYYPPKSRRWGLSQERVNLFEQRGKIRINKSKSYVNCFGDLINEKPELLYDSEPLRSDWLDIPGYSQVHKFSTENSEELLQRVIESGTRENDIVLDYFLGSGTTVATAHKLNRKWIGIEMGSQFDDFILPRMKIVLNGDKTGISKKVEAKKGGFFKYQYLEKFDDTIRNIKNHQNQNSSSLEIDNIQNPFDLKLTTSEKNQLKEANIDIIETFNYLMGIFITKIEVLEDKTRMYIFIEGNVDDDQIVVVWRSIIEIDYDRDKNIIKDYLKDKDCRYIYVNGKSLIKNSRSIEMELKKLMCA